MNRIVSARRNAVLALSLFGISIATGLPDRAAFAFDASSTKAINVDGAGLMLRGHDPVAYFTAGNATKGSPEFSATQNSATFYFASAANRDAFKADPAKYQPQFGGFCAMGVALGKKLDGDPEVFRLVDGKLYLNVSRDAQKKWSEDTSTNISNANSKWPAISAKAPKDIN